MKSTVFVLFCVTFFAVLLCKKNIRIHASIGFYSTVNFLWRNILLQINKQENFSEEEFVFLTRWVTVFLEEFFFCMNATYRHNWNLILLKINYINNVIWFTSFVTNFFCEFMSITRIIWKFHGKYFFLAHKN